MALSIKGVINSDGSIRAGQGFRCQKAGSGFYAIEFDTPFESAPIAMCTLDGSPEDGKHQTVSIISIAACQFVCATASPDSPQDAGFKFIVIGHGQQSQADAN